MKKYYIFEMNMTTLNIVSILLVIFMFALTGVIINIIPNFELSSNSLFLPFALMIPYFILHEILHSIGYVLHGAKWKNITYGAHLEKGVLCCLCKQKISKKCILISLIYPLFFIGIVTYILGIYLNNFTLIFLSVLNISGAAGDIVMFLSFLKIKDFEYSEYDDPTSFGLYSKEDLSKLKLFGLKYKESKKDLEIKDYKKINISKTSIVVFIIITLLVILLSLTK